MEENRKIYQHLIAGIGAGITSTTILYPLQLIKTRMQVTNSSITAYSSLSDAFRTIIRNEGFLGLYQGLSPALIGIILLINFDYSIIYY